jgi:hypothetical protein
VNFDLDFPKIFMAGRHNSKAKVLKIIPINLTGKGEYAVSIHGEELKIYQNP